MLESAWPLYRRIPLSVRRTLHSLMQVFLDEVCFEGCGGLVLTEDMKTLVAAQACLLVAGRNPRRPYPRLRSVLLYPHSYVAGENENTSVRLGESWAYGTVILSWHSVEGGARNREDGHNVTLHEFAHQLDQADGQADGAPRQDTSLAARTWSTCMRREYQQFLRQLEKGQRTVVDAYGATNGAEFFATLTEAFFEKPRQLHRKEPELYEALRGYFQLDPKAWVQLESDPAS
jgi:Mlc titration factor MtfA (ptsG expression regulator)